MNKGANVGGGGPTAAAAAAAAQKQKSLLQRVDADIGNIVDNYGFIVNAARVHAADSLLKLVSELKQTAMFSGFASLNDHVEQRTEEFTKQTEKTECMLSRIGEEAAASLKDLESHYYSSAERTSSLLSYNQETMP
ncbi:mediator of RNA polymerase II transcription subunit 22a-like isoform X2 [Solanum dulcamara]|uniref:mediator of RNA polymerase II transcription subunit 22a-like isoform X2 n=1 Tax=Solanum dulcamara TaxID=45834 RepID=UPI0024852858|nr:mediator of RNA polymerase II transcription subunit 22a-like isoform X2 [Solanum dulcamara]